MLLSSPTFSKVVASEDAVEAVASFSYVNRGSTVEIVGDDGAVILSQTFSGSEENLSHQVRGEVLAPQLRALATRLGGPIRAEGHLVLPVGWILEEDPEVDATKAFLSWVSAAKADLKELGGKGTSSELALKLGVSQQTLNQAEKGVKGVSLDRLANWLVIWGRVAPAGARRWTLEIDGEVALKPAYPVGFYRIVDTFNETIVSRHPTLSGAAESLKSQVHSWHKIQVKTETGWSDTTLEAEGYYR